MKKMYCWLKRCCNIYAKEKRNLPLLKSLGDNCTAQRRHAGSAGTPRCGNDTLKPLNRQKTAKRTETGIGNDEKWQKEAAAVSFGAPDDPKLAEGSSPFLPATPLTLDECISFLQRLRNDVEQLEAARRENERLKRERAEWQARNEQLAKKAERLEARQTTVHEDYEALVKIMARARQLASEEGDRFSLAQLLLSETGGQVEPMAHS